jgi:hypothetical protein
MFECFVTGNMSAKSDDKNSEIYFTEKQPQSSQSYKRNKMNTSEKLYKTSKEQKFQRNGSSCDDDDEGEAKNDAKLSPYAESKHDKRQRSSTEGALPVGKPLGRDVISLDSLDEIDEADREFQNLLTKPNEGFYSSKLCS